MLSEGGGVAVINQEDMWELIRQRESNRKIPDDHTVRTELLLDARSNKKQKENVGFKNTLRGKRALKSSGSNQPDVFLSDQLTGNNCK